MKKKISSVPKKRVKFNVKKVKSKEDDNINLDKDFDCHSSNCGKSHRFFGVLLISLGIIFGLHSLGLFNLSIWSYFSTFWPIGLIIAGIAFLFRVRWLGWTVIIITAVLGIFYLTSSVESGELRTVEQSIESQEGVDIVELSLEYGAGDLSILSSGEDNSSNIVVNRIKTYDTFDPNFSYKTKNNILDVEIDRRPINGIRFWEFHDDEWNIELSPDYVYVLDFGFGASDMEVDLSGLRVDELSLEYGASDLSVKFGDYPTKAEFDFGASDLSLSFPKGSSVRIEFDGGITSTNFKDFSNKGDGVYESPEFDESEYIDVKIDAGASDIESSFY